MLKKSQSPMNPTDADEGTPVSVKIRERLQAARKRFNANDNIAEFIEPGELDAFAGAGHELATIEDLSPREVRARMDDPGVRVLDVRRATEFAAGHLEDAINIAHTRLPSRLDEAPRDSELVVHCLGGWRSARAASYLQRLGYRVSNLAGGYNAWVAAGLGTTTGAATPTGGA